MSLATTFRLFGHSPETRIHPRFFALHARLLNAPELMELVESDISAHTFFELYPISLSAYLPFLSEVFPDRAAALTLCKLKTMPENLVDMCAYQMSDAALMAQMSGEQVRQEEVKVFLRQASRGGNRLETTLTRVKFQSQILGVYETMLLLSNWSGRGFASLPPNNQQQLTDHITGLERLFGV